MQQRYIGLTLGQVYENRQRFGANVVQVPTTENWSTMLQSVCNYWMVKLFYFISLLTIFLLPLLDLLGVQMYTIIWSILIVLPILLMIIFTIVLLNGQYNKIKSKYEIDIYAIVLLLFLISQTAVIYYQSLDLDISLLKLYKYPMILASIMIMIELVRFIIRLKRKKHTSKQEEIDDLQTVNVIRDGRTVQILRKDVVVGDIICLYKGDKVPADAELLEAYDLIVDEYNITEKSQCHKSAEYNPENQLDSTILPNQVLRASTIIQGQAIAKVFAVGEQTIYAKNRETKQKKIKKAQSQSSYLLTPADTRLSI